jgi:hypothetical protein
MTKLPLLKDSLLDGVKYMIKQGKNISRLFRLFCKNSFFAEFRSVPFLILGMGSSETHGIPRKEHFFRGITKTFPSLFREIFS